MSRGGRRVGAGAKPKAESDRTKMITFRLKQHTIASIQALAARLGLSQAKTIERALGLLEASCKETPSDSEIPGGDLRKESL